MLLAWFQSELVPVVVHNSKITRIVTLYSGACLLDRRDDEWVLQLQLYPHVMSEMFLITVSYCCDPNIFVFLSHHRKSVSCTSIRLHNWRQPELSPHHQRSHLVLTQHWACCYPPECADSFLHSCSHVHVWASQTLLCWPAGRKFLCNSPDANRRSRASTCLILLEGGWCRQQPPAGFKNKAGVKCRSSGPAPAVYLRMAEAV